MVVETIQSIFRLRRDTAANWASVNPVLDIAEPALETDTLKVKYGDGSTAWNTLPYSAGSAYAVDPDGTLAANSDARVATQKATKTYVGNAVTGVLKFKGSTNCSTNPNYPAAVKGDSYAVSTAGKIGGASGTDVDIGDVYFAVSDNAGGTQAAVGSSWDILEHNLRGALLSANNLSDLANAATARTNLGLAAIAASGSASDLSTGTVPAARMPAITGDVTTVAGAVAATLATVNLSPGTYGSASQSLTATVDAKGRITGLSAQTIAAAWAAITGKPTTLVGYGITDAINSSALDTDGTLAANSDARIATQKATKAYVDQIIAAQDAMVFKGVIDCSTNPNYPAADKGHTYRISVAGKIGGASGINVEPADLIICLTDGTAAGTQAAVGANWTVTQANIDGAVIGPSSAADASVAGFNGTTGKLIKQLSSAEVRAAADITSATSKTTPVDADEIPIVDSAASNVLKKLTWANLKATLKTYFDALYASRPSGTVFPGSPTTGSFFYRTDRNIEYYYDGTRWLSTQVYFVPIPNTDFLLPRTATTLGMCRAANPWAALYDIYVMDAIFHNYITATSTWTLAIIDNNATTPTTLATRSTASDAANTHLSNRVAVNAVVTSAVDNLQGEVTLVSGAASLYCSFGLAYRLVG
jgi:hypothetical protein